MSNFEMFLRTVNMLKGSQGFYSRLACDIAQMSEQGLKDLEDYLNKQPPFSDTVDVVLFLEG